ncbi:M12 family metallopeptidase [Kitasatospora sp. NBC_00240]|uniref:M12 family metallopeptidase n=1 Tax=Kitasatospora sp. NBC_00240 TaxID=2903567 RepID=UPI002258067F|nr:M12 family metallopeptidase [Kitasatospora sp. NBC_00240]MCX5211618.1 M12 family metallopeptidase [Kitasatospora sp. NBC_00240]
MAGVRSTVADYGPPRYCSQKPSLRPAPAPGLAPHRAHAIIAIGNKWLNGTVLRYCFLDSTGGGRGPGQLDAVRAALREWKDLGIGLDFKEVDDSSESEVRIDFQGRFSESVVGTDVLQVGQHEATTNFGWDLTDAVGHATALHETGHVLGFDHEHQNPNAGIEWEEEKVYAALALPPNEWDRETTFFNIIRKLDPATVSGSVFDADSIMEYPFPPGLIKRPKKYRIEGIPDPLSLSAFDKDMVQQWYPTLVARPRHLEPRESVALPKHSGGQSDFEITPAESRKYALATFGDADVVMALFERVNGDLRYVTADDDSGQDRNGRLDVKLFKGRTYVVRARLYSTWGSSEAALMYW